MSDDDFLAKARTIGVIGKNVGKPRFSTERTEKSTVITTEHWDGRRDATVRPDIVRYGAKVHNTGKRKGHTAEVSKMAPKQAKERYGDR